mmetsp:Transcript_4606/g.9746  ORF Transcript_4606/g.9746 Transcript_4606/m.9746 type:complete len:227 (-) Transcript_4606:1946-2626(-)
MCASARRGEMRSSCSIASIRRCNAIKMDSRGVSLTYRQHHNLGKNRPRNRNMTRTTITQNSSNCELSVQETPLHVSRNSRSGRRQEMHALQRSHLTRRTSSISFARQMYQPCGETSRRPRPASTQLNSCTRIIRLYPLQCASSSLMSVLIRRRRRKHTVASFTSRELPRHHPHRLLHKLQEQQQRPPHGQHLHHLQHSPLRLVQQDLHRLHLPLQCLLRHNSINQE